jgi:hypothetical protein
MGKFYPRQYSTHTSVNSRRAVSKSMSTLPLSLSRKSSLASL